MTSPSVYWKTWWGRPGWDRFIHVAAAITFLLAAGLFLELADDAPEGDYLPVEDKIMQAMRRSGEPWGPAGTAIVMRDITAMGSATVLALMSTLILCYLALCRRYRVVALLGLAIFGGQGINVALKHIFARERPAAALHLVEVSSTSFPSGHAMAASIFYLTVGALLARTATRRREKIFFVGAAMGITALIGFSRVYLGVHYPTDVLAGWAAGTAWALACWFGVDWLGRRGSLRAETGEPPTVPAGELSRGGFPRSNK